MSTKYKRGQSNREVESKHSDLVRIDIGWEAEYEVTIDTEAYGNGYVPRETWDLSDYQWILDGRHVGWWVIRNKLGSMGYVDWEIAELKKEIMDEWSED